MLRSITVAPRRLSLGLLRCPRSSIAGKPSVCSIICAVVLFCSATVVASPAQTIFKTLVNFNKTDGSEPVASLIQGADGNLYGTTAFGGASGDGTVFKVRPSGRLTTLHSFSGDDGANPTAGVVQDKDGNLYGTTSEGGANGCQGCGTVFKITPGGKLTTLHSFCSVFECPDGDAPFAGLVQGTNGDFYGTTALGGANGEGTVFKITARGKLTTLYSFCSQTNCTDGFNPMAGLVQASDGDFYGTTEYGGANYSGLCSGYGCGTIFKITAKGTLTTLYSFCSKTHCRDGAYPQAGLIQSRHADFYGTTTDGGTSDKCTYGCGTVFRIGSRGNLATLHRFDGTDGELPEAGLVQATDGNFYGTTSGDYTNFKGGTIFKITAGGKLTTLHNFHGIENTYPFGGLIQATSGTFYGTTSGGDADAYGTVFSLSGGLDPFVETRPTSVKLGNRVIILGNSVKSTTTVAFNVLRQGDVVFRVAR